MKDTEQKPLIVAVSGGVDSVVLLHVLSQTQVPLIVAHVDHGVRVNSHEDAKFVEGLAAAYDVPFESTELRLGPEASEERARNLRYIWLESMREQYTAQTIVTAHHQDDVLETMLINIIRGTGWRGLCSLRSTPERYRPLLSMSKAEIVAYALDNKLEWREDETNASFRYLRNRIRHQVLPRLSNDARQRLVSLSQSQLHLRDEIEQETARLVEQYCEGWALARYPVIMIEEAPARELLRGWLGTSLETSRLSDLLLFAKTALPGAKWSLTDRRFVRADQQRLIVLPSRD